MSLDDIAPPPAERLEIERAPLSGWCIRFDGHVEACFSSAAEMADWLERTLSPLDRDTAAQPVEPLPVMLDRDRAQPRRSLWWRIREACS